jgi:methylamine utilization protein MauE
MTELLVAVLGALSVIFGTSAVTKLAGLERQQAFARSLRALRLLPAPFVVPVAAAVSAVEVGIFTGTAAALLGTVTGASWGVPVAVVALLLAVGLLVVLTVGIVVALHRHRIAPCACFSRSDRPLSWRHVLRNGLMLLVGVTGVTIAVAVTPAAPDPVAAGVAGATSVVVAVVLVRLDEILELFAPSNPGGRVQARS